MSATLKSGLTTTERARVAARGRWGPPRLIRLDALTNEQRRLVVALVEAAKMAAPAIVSPGAAEPEVRRVSVEHPAA